MIPFLLLLNRAARTLPFAGSRRIVLVDIGSGLVLSGVLPSVMVDDTYSAKLSARGGVAPYTYSIVAGGLPDGLFIDAGTGIISGTATTKGAFAFTVRVVDLSGAYLDRQYSILVAQGAYGTLTLSGTYDAATVGTAYSSDLTISGGDGSYSTARVTAGSVPTGLALSIVGNKLRLAGIPTGSAGTVSFTVAVDSGDAQTATSAQSVVVSAAATFATFDPAYKSSLIVLTGGNLVAQSSNNYAGMVRGTVALAGKKYFEFQFTSALGTGASIAAGVCNSSEPTSAPFGFADADGWAVWGPNGYGVQHNGVTAVAQDLVAGDVIGVAYDAGTGRLWFRYNGTWLGAGSPNPATNTAPNYTGVTGTIYPAASPWASAVVVAARFDPASFRDAAPSGFGAVTG